MFAHEYAGIGSLFSSKAVHEERREAASLATFLFITLLLPVLLVAPIERDIRVVSLVNPFYAAAIPSFTKELISSMNTPFPACRSLFLSEGHRALRTVVLTRHLQRILNALPNRAPTFDAHPGREPGKTSPSDAPESGPSDLSEEKSQPKLPSNIVAVSVAPGTSRTETVRTAIGADRELEPDSYSAVRMFM